MLAGGNQGVRDQEMDVSSPLLLPRAPASVPNARRNLHADLESAGIDEATVADAVLVLSELLSNALRHAGPLPDPFPPDSVRVTWTVRRGGRVAGSTVEIQICDGGGATLPRISRPSVSALGGRGLALVERVAARWGTEVDDCVTTVWAVLPCSAPEPECSGSGSAVATSEFSYSVDREYGEHVPNCSFELH